MQFDIVYQILGVIFVLGNDGMLRESIQPCINFYCCLVEWFHFSDDDDV